MLTHAKVFALSGADGKTPSSGRIVIHPSITFSATVASPAAQVSISVWPVNQARAAFTTFGRPQQRQMTACGVCGVWSAKIRSGAMPRFFPVHIRGEALPKQALI
jgi:hypothetical protein